MSAAVCHSIGFKLKPKSLNSTASQDAFVPGKHARSFVTQKRPRLSLRCGYSEREHHKVETKPLAPLNRKRQPSLRLRARIRLWRHLMKKFVLKVSFAGLLKFLQRHWRRLLTGGILGCMLAAGCFLLQLSAAYAPKPVPYSTLIQSLEAHMVPRVLFEEGSSQIFFNMVPEASNQLEESGADQGAAIVEDGSLTEAKKEESQSASNVESPAKSVDNRARKPPLPTWQYCTRKVRHDETYLLSLLRNGAGKVEYSSAPRSFSSIALSVVGTIVTLWIPLSPVLWLMHRQITGKSDFSKKPRRNVQVVRFEDVAGVDTAKAELWEIVSCLRGQSKYRSLGAKFPKGVLLIGPPGTGKTLLARALAWEAGVPFFAASASEFVEMFVGRGAARIRELFALARKCAPSIVFIDELDAVGGQRGRGFNDERDQTLNQLLTEMDGFESETGVLVLAATNRLEALDPALCRPGRLSRRVYVREPDLEGRKQVLAVHMRGVSVDGDPEAIQRVVAAITSGLAGADLANVVNEAALLAARKGQSAVTLENFKEAVNRAKYGVGQGPSFFSDLERKICAVVETLVPRRGDEKEGYQGVN